MPLFENYDELEKAQSPDNETAAPDALVTEAAHVLIDALNLPEQERVGNQHSLPGAAYLHAGRFMQPLHARADTP